MPSVGRTTRSTRPGELLTPSLPTRATHEEFARATRECAIRCSLARPARDASAPPARSSGDRPHCKCGAYAKNTRNGDAHEIAHFHGRYRIPLARRGSPPRQPRAECRRHDARASDPPCARSPTSTPSLAQRIGELGGHGTAPFRRARRLPWPIDPWAASTTSGIVDHLIEETRWRTTPRVGTVRHPDHTTR